MASSQPVNLRSIAAVAFIPPAIFSVCTGVITPMIPLTAAELGGSAAVASLVVAALALGQLLSDPPAGLLTARFGERNAMVGSGLLCAASLAMAAMASSLVVFVSALFVTGMSTAVWMLARQALVTELVPAPLLGRAMSSLAGVQRIGLFCGPFLGALVSHLFDHRSTYILGAALVLLAIASLLIAREPVIDASPTPVPERQHYLQLLRGNRSTFLTLGSGVVFVSIVRASRQIVLPLWGAHIGLDASVISLLFGASGAIDLLLFYPAGKLMDRFGRRPLAIISMTVLAAAHVLIPLTGDVFQLLLVGLLLGIGNGLSTGLVLTIGADAAPPHQRAMFFGIWRFLSDGGLGAGPLLLGAFAAITSLGGAAVAMSAFGLAAAGILGRWLPPRDRRTARSGPAPDTD